MLLAEPLFGEERTDLSGLDNLAEGLRLPLHITALKADDAVGQCVALLARDILADNLDQVGQRHDGTADDEVVAVFLIFTAQVLRVAVVETDGTTHLLGNTDLLARTVDELEAALGEEDGQGHTGKTTTGAEVEDAGAGTETQDLGDGQGVEYVVLVEIVDVLTRDDVDLFIPLPVKSIKGIELALLPFCQPREIFADDIVHVSYWKDLLSRGFSSP